MLEAELAMAFMADRELMLDSPLRAHQERWRALQRMDRLERELGRERRRWSTAPIVRPA